MSKPTGGQTTTCDKCGEPRVIYPPTPEYKDMLLQPCEEGDSIERAFDCERCNEINKRYWDKEHVIFVSGGSSQHNDELSSRYRGDKRDFVIRDDDIPHY
jgi:hypothetical protein